MDANNQIAQIVWNKGDYIIRCIWKWEDHFIKTGELLTWPEIFAKIAMSTNITLIRMILTKN